MDAERTGICLVGCGRVAKSHLAGAKQAKDSVRVAALVSRDAKKGEQYAACCGDVPVFATLEEAAARCAFEAVDLCVPNDLHCEYALRSAALGKHILVEKPMANTPAGLCADGGCRQAGGGNADVGTEQAVLPGRSALL